MTIRKSATENGFIIFKDQLSLLKLIPNEQLGEAIKLLLENFDELPEKNNLVYEMIATNIRRYREQSKISAEMGKKRWEPKENPEGSQKEPNATIQEKKIQNNTKQRKNNTIPSLQEVIDYCKERNNFVDANEWFDYYSANGWKVGKNPMKDWKSCVRYWERGDKRKPVANEQPILYHSDVSGNKIDQIVAEREKSDREQKERAEEAQRRADFLKSKGYPSILSLISAGQDVYNSVMDEYKRQAR